MKGRVKFVAKVVEQLRLTSISWTKGEIGPDEAREYFTSFVTDAVKYGHNMAARKATKLRKQNGSHCNFGVVE